MDSTAPRDALPPGHDLLWYRIERVLGRGGFGITYLARDLNLDRPVAVKEYFPADFARRAGGGAVAPADDPSRDFYKRGLRQFANEAQTLARFDHPNIVRVLSVFEQNGTAYMVMRYEQGASLAELLKARGTLDEARLLGLAHALLDGLEAVHAAGIIHRDIKPNNIFIREDGRPLLIDFGSSRQALGEQTRTLTQLVSPGYAPFEQYHGKSNRQGPWTDIYALGATLYRACTGTAPIDAVSRSQGLLQDGGDPYQPATRIAGGRYSAAFLAAIDQALCFDEQDRPQSAAAWRALLPPAAQTEATAAATTVLEDTEDLWRAFIGPRARKHYLAAFRARRARPWRIGWNWAAALATIPWLAYRRLPLWAVPLHLAATAATALVVLVPVSAIGFGGGEMPEPLALGIILAASIPWPGLFADSLYYLYFRRLLDRGRHRNLAGEELAAFLGRRGGVSPLGTALALLLLGGILALMLAGG